MQTLRIVIWFLDKKAIQAFSDKLDSELEKEFYMQQYAIGGRSSLPLRCHRCWFTRNHCACAPLLYISELCEDCTIANEIDYAWTGIHDNKHVITACDVLLQQRIDAPKPFTNKIDSSWKRILHVKRTLHEASDAPNHSLTNWTEWKRNSISH